MSSLERISQQSPEKFSFWQKLKNYSLSGSLAVLLITSPLTGCKSRECSVDNDCPSNQLCVSSVCLDGECVGDSDCPGEKVCENGYCHELPIASSTPEEVYQGWVQSLKSGNLEESLKYISPSSQNLQKALAGTINLPLEVQGFGYGQSLSQIGNQLGDNNLTFKEEFGNYRDYSFACQDTSGQSWECLIRFLKDENGKWKIYGF